MIRRLQEILCSLGWHTWTAKERSVATIDTDTGDIQVFTEDQECKICKKAKRIIIVS